MLNNTMAYTAFTYSDWSAAQRGFMEDFDAATRPDTIYRVFNDEVRFMLYPLSLPHGNSDHLIRLREIKAANPGQGAGRRGMGWLLGLADQHDMEIRLMVDAFNYTARMPKDEDLAAWYKRLGFTGMLRPIETTYTNEMRRKPQILRSFP